MASEGSTELKALGSVGLCEPGFRGCTVLTGLLGQRKGPPLTHYPPWGVSGSEMVLIIWTSISPVESISLRSPSWLLNHPSPFGGHL